MKAEIHIVDTALRQIYKPFNSITENDGENGLLVPPNDPRALLDALTRLIKNPELIQKMADQIGAVHTLYAHVHDLEKIYETCRTEKEHCT